VIPAAELDMRGQARARSSRRQHPWVRMAVSLILSWIALFFYGHAVADDVLVETYIAFYIANTIIITVSLWRIFEKACLPGWAAIVPFYNFAMLYRLVGRPARQSALLLVPILNVYLFIRLMDEVARAFGGDRILTVALLVSPFIAFPMMAFGRAAYRSVGPAS
jgi:hypothetical protein